MRNFRDLVTGFTAAALVVGVAALATAAWHVQQDDARAMARMQAEINQLSSHQSQQANWPQLTARIEPSVFTISTHEGLGPGCVVRSDASGSDLVTNYHVVTDALSAGTHSLEVLQADRTLRGTIVRTDPTDDLAVVHVRERLVPLAVTATRPRLGEAVMVVGSPLGLGGTVSIGLVSGFRSIEGSDWVQFSAPISPGNSGGPVVDGQGRVIGVASGKYVGDGVEALGFAIPIAVACAELKVCAET